MFISHLEESVLEQRSFAASWTSAGTTTNNSSNHSSNTDEMRTTTTTTSMESTLIWNRRNVGIELPSRIKCRHGHATHFLAHDTTTNTPTTGIAATSMAIARISQSTGQSQDLKTASLMVTWQLAQKEMLMETIYSRWKPTHEQQFLSVLLATEYFDNPCEQGGVIMFGDSLSC